MVTEGALEYNYHGPSMNPTFRAGDRLRVEPCVSRKIERGDVIVFSPTGNDLIITHRIIAIEQKGVVTRGDNNDHVDPYWLQSHEIIGHVTQLRRGNRIVKVTHGTMGFLYARVRWVINSISHTVYPHLHPLYRSLARTGIFSRLFRYFVLPEIICFNKPDGIEQQLFINRHLIGRRRPGSAEWQIRRPFRLFIDPSLLHE